MHRIADLIPGNLCVCKCRYAWECCNGAQVYAEKDETLVTTDTGS